MPEGYSEATEHPRVAPVPLSHLSIEVGHFTLKAIAEDTGFVRGEFRRIAPLVAAFTESARIRFGPEARISTCYLIDDYFTDGTDPAMILPLLLDAAESTGVVIDYVARESACARYSVVVDGVPLGEPIPVAEMVAARIVPEPAPPDTGGRPPTTDSGWLCNGRRSSTAAPTQAMRGRTYVPPEAFGTGEHSIFIDVERWSQLGGSGSTRWSCPFLTAIWHLLRLGMVRYHGEPVASPRLRARDAAYPSRWSDLPPVIQFDPRAQPFAAYRTLSLLPERRIAIEHAVGVILDHLDLDEDVTSQIADAGAAENITVPPTAGERLSHLLLDGS
jgi:hypothetical protein